MRITYLHQYFNTPAMAGGTRSYEMARRLVDKGHSVTMVTTRRDGRADKTVETWEAGIRVIWLPVPYDQAMSYGQKIRAFLRFARLSARVAAGLEADLVFATSTPLTIALPGAYAAWRQRVVMVLEVRDLWPEGPIEIGALRNPVARAAARTLARFAYARSARVVALAPGMKQGVCATGYPEDRVDIIPNGADRTFFQTDRAAGSDLAAHHPWLGDGPVLTYTGAIGRINAVGYIVRLAAALDRRHPKLGVRVAILGDGNEAARVRDLAHELGVLDRVVHFLGQRPKTELPAWLAASTATFVTCEGLTLSMRDCVFNKFFDSLAAERPVIANFSGFATDIAAGTGAGVILPNADVDAAADRLADHLSQPGWADAAGRKAAALGRDHFDRDYLADLLEQAMQRAVSPHKPGASPLGTAFERLAKANPPSA